MSSQKGLKSIHVEHCLSWISDDWYFASIFIMMHSVQCQSQNKVLACIQYANVWLGLKGLICKRHFIFTLPLSPRLLEAPAAIPLRKTICAYRVLSSSNVSLMCARLFYVQVYDECSFLL